MTSAKKIYLAVAGGLVAAGVVLAGTGFIASGLDPAVFTALENIEPGAGGEYQLTDGYARMIDLPEEEGGGLYGVVIDERRFDTGDKLGYLEANVTLALEDPALGAELREFLRSKLED